MQDPKQASSSRTLLSYFLLGCIAALSACQPQHSQEHSPLVNSYWKLTVLDGASVSMAPSQEREAHFVLSEEDSRVSGFDACNQFFGEYETQNVQSSGGEISFKGFGSTKRLCPDTQVNEQAFFEAFNNAASYSINGASLELEDAQGESLASFQSVETQ